MTTPEAARLIASLQDMHDRMRDGFWSAEPSKKLLRDAIDALAALSQPDEARDAARYRHLTDVHGLVLSFVSMARFAPARLSSTQ